MMDNEKFTELYRQFFSRVYNFVYHRVKNAAAADDVVSEIFLKVYQKYETFKGDSEPATWIFRLAMNTLTDYYRREGRKREDDWADFFDRPSAREHQPEVQALIRENREELLRAIDGLSDREKNIIELKYFGGLSNGAIAELMELSYTNVGFIHHRAIGKLRAALEKNF